MSDIKCGDRVTWWGVALWSGKEGWRGGVVKSIEQTSDGAMATVLTDENSWYFPLVAKLTLVPADPPASSLALICTDYELMREYGDMGGQEL